MIIRFGREDYIDTKALMELVEEENASGATQDNQEEQQ